MFKTEEGLEFSVPEVDVTKCSSLEDAIMKLRMLVQKDGILKKLSEKERYEKPSEKKKRKIREARNRRLFEEMKEKMIASGEWEKRMKEKEEKRSSKRRNYLNNEENL